MAKRHYSAQDYLLIPLQNVVIQTTGADPGSPALGQLWFNTALDRYRVKAASGIQTVEWTGHTHDASSIVSGILALVRGGTGADLSGAATGALFTKQAGAALAALGQGSGGQVLTSGGAGAQPSWSSPATSLPPNGPAGGSLAGSYPNPSIAPGAIGITETAASLRGPGASNGGSAADNVPALRALGINQGFGYALPSTVTLNQINAPTTDLSLAGFRLVSVGTPVSSSDAATKSYVDGLVQGIAAHPSVRAASTANVNLAQGGAQAMDGVNLVNGDRALIKAQSSPADNGLYVLTGANGWQRADDANTAPELRSAFVFVEEGATNANTGWLQTADNITLGTTALTWVQFSGAGTYTNGLGINLSGTQFSLAVDGAIFTFSGNTLTLLANSITGAHLAPGSVDLASTDVVGVLPLSKGGTGATTNAGVRTAFGIPLRQSATCPALTAGAWASVTFASAFAGYPALIVVETSSLEQVDIEVRVGDANNVIALRSDVPVAAGALTVIEIA